MEKKVLGLLVVFLLVTSTVILYTGFTNQKEQSQNEMEKLEVSFKTIDKDGREFLDIEVLHYTDATYLEVGLGLENTGDEAIVITDPGLSLYLESEFILEKELEEIKLEPGEETKIILDDLKFDSEIINMALSGGTVESNGTIGIKGVLAVEKDFRVFGVKVKSYEVSREVGGRILLREIFGGKSKEEAVEDILKLRAAGGS